MSLLRSRKQEEWSGIRLELVIYAGRYKLTVGPIPSFVWAVVETAEVATMLILSIILWLR